MKFVFNDIFASSSELFKDVNDSKPVIVSSNLIFEKNIKTAQVSDADYRGLLQDYLTGSDQDRARILREDYPNFSEEQQRDFTNEITKSEQEAKKKRGEGKTITENVINTVIDDSESTGKPGENLSLKLVNRNKIVSLLRSSGFSEEQIGKLFFDFIDNYGIPESLTLTFLLEGLSAARAGRTSYPKVLEFILVHYQEQRDAQMTLDIVKEASEAQAQNPDVPIFDMLIDGAKGQLPDIAQVALIDDDDKRSAVLELLKLSQLRIVEQGEAVRRQLQVVRDRLQTVQEQVNRQRAIVDILKTIEVDRVLVDEIRKFGDVFVNLMTSTMFRALRDIMYDIAAGRKLLDMWGSLYVDTQPVTPRQTDVEMKGRPLADSPMSGDIKTEQEGVFRRKDKIVSNANRFVKIAQEAVDQADESAKINKICRAAASVFDKLSAERSEGLNETGKKGFQIYCQISKSVLSACRSINSVNNYPGNVAAQFEQQTSDFILKKKASKEIAGTSRKFTAQKAIYDGFIKLAQAQTQTEIRPTENADRNLNNFINECYFALLNAASFEVHISTWNTANFEGFLYYHKLNSISILNQINEEALQEGIGGIKVPTQQNIFGPNGELTEFGAQVFQNEKDVNEFLQLSEAESNARIKLKLKREQNKVLIDNTEKNINNEIRMLVDLGDTQTEGETPLATPQKVKEKYESFKLLLKECIKQAQLEKDLLVRAFNRLKSDGRTLDPFKVKLTQNIISGIEKDLIDFKNKYGKIASTALIVAQMQRKLRLLQKLGPIQKAIAKFKKAGMSTAALISQPNGFLRQLYLIRNEEEQALDILLDAYKKVTVYHKPVDLNAFLKQNPTTSTGEVLLGDQKFTDKEKTDEKEI